MEGNQWGWGSPEIVALFATAVIGLVAFVVLEQRVSAPMLDFRFFRSRTFLGANVVAFIVTFAMLATFFFVALYMQNFLGYGALEAGVRFLPATAVIIVVAPIAGRLADKVGPRRLMTGGLLVVALSMYLQTHITVDSGYGVLLPAFMLMGLGMGFVMSPMSTAAMNAVTESKAGAASGILSMSRMVGGTFGVAALGALFQHLSTERLADSLSGTGVTAAQREHLVENLGAGAGGDTVRGLDPATAEQVGSRGEGLVHPCAVERHVAGHRPRADRRARGLAAGLGRPRDVAEAGCYSTPTAAISASPITVSCGFTVIDAGKTLASQR